MIEFDDNTASVYFVVPFESVMSVFKSLSLFFWVCFMPKNLLLLKHPKDSMNTSSNAGFSVYGR